MMTLPAKDKVYEDDITYRQYELLKFFPDEESWANCMIDAFEGVLKGPHLQEKYKIPAGAVILVYRLLIKRLDKDDDSR